MTDIAVFTQPFQAEDLSWDLSNPEVPYVESGTLDITKFVQAQHFANGYIPSGTVLGKVTASGLLGPYLDAASDGTQTAVGILRASIQVVQPTGALKAKVGCPVLRAFGVIRTVRLPFLVGNAAAGGYIDAAAQTDLKNLFFTTI